MPYRKIVFWLHLAAGLAVGALVFSMSVTGVLLAFEPQIVNWSERHVRSVEKPAPDSRRVSLDILLGNARGKFPAAAPTDVRLWSHPATSVSVNMGKETGTIYVNPYTGDIIGGSSRTHAVLQWIEDWHRFLGSRNVWKPINDAANLVFLFILVSGLYLWWPRRWTRRALKNITVPNLKLKGKARDWNWHNALGFWTAPLLILIVVTGAIISYRWASDLVYVVSGNAPPPRPQQEKADVAKKGAEGMSASKGAAAAPAFTLPAASLDTILARAESKIPVWSTISLRLPRKPGAPIVATIQEPGFGRRYARSQLTVNAASAEVIKWEPHSEYNLGRKMRAWVVPLHTGRAGGIPGQILAAVVAAISALLVWTGVAMSWRRFFKPSKSKGRSPRRPDIGQGSGHLPASDIGEESSSRTVESMSSLR